MTTTSLTAQFEDILEAEQLADVRSAFTDPDFCDEVPLYSRFEQVAFLKDTGDADRTLVELSLDYLDRVLASVPMGPDGWAAITLIRDADDELIVPAMFLCTRQAKQRLSDLRLAAGTRTDFGAQVRKLVATARADWSVYTLLEDTQTVPGQVRVFIAKQIPPVPVLFG